ncbi:MAG: SRPBCC family protein [Steroidobacteraceae bacterium]
MTERTRGYAHRIDVPVDVRAVWDALTTAPAIGLWCSPDAGIDARPGGSFHANVDRITQFEAHIDLYVPLRRMRLIHLTSPLLPSAESAIVDDFMLEGAEGAATLRLLGSGFPTDASWDVMYLRRRTGWERALARLKVVLTRAATSPGDAAPGNARAGRS